MRLRADAAVVSGPLSRQDRRWAGVSPRSAWTLSAPVTTLFLRPLRKRLPKE